jgi:hypothetical protein
MSEFVYVFAAAMVVESIKTKFFSPSKLFSLATGANNKD